MNCLQQPKNSTISNRQLHGIPLHPPVEADRQTTLDGQHQPDAPKITKKSDVSSSSSEVQSQIRIHVDVSKGKEKNPIEALTSPGRLVNRSVASGVQSDLSRYLNWLEDSANEGIALAQISLAEMYLEGIGVQQDSQRAADWFLMAAQGGDARAQHEIGYLYLHGKGVEQDLEQAVYWYKQAADRGNADAQTNLGLMYENGDGVQRDANLALYWYRKAADLDNADAQTNLAQMYDWGDAVEQDLEQAVYWSQRAADQGDASAMIGLADVYLDNEDFHKDKERGIYWLAKAADLGSPGAQCRLAIRYWTGDAVHQNFELAAKWLRKAADQDNADAQIYLAQMHENGQGVEQDFKQAVYWYLRSKVHFTTSNDEVYSLSDKSDNLISCIPEVLRDFREFDSCDTLNLNDFRFSEAGFAAIDQLIRFNRSLTRICISYLCIDNETYVTAMLRKLVESIRETIPTHRPPTLKFYDVNYPFLIQSIDHNQSIIDDPLRIQIDQLIELIEQNKAIYDLRLPLEKNPPAKSDELPLEVLKILADKLIFTSIRDGKTKEATQAAVDEFLMSAQYHKTLDSAVQVSRLPILPKNAAQ